ncbi:MAG: hypothetical protein D6698_15765 [Gammaproteobacteria bacterium]|nr:MAG: hypothetical protein D6698_15765 [Gammaproteobacteria bacterium]
MPWLHVQTFQVARAVAGRSGATKDPGPGCRHRNLLPLGGTDSHRARLNAAFNPEASRSKPFIRFACAAESFLPYRQPSRM